MNKEYRLEVGTDSQQIIQILEDKIYGHNSAKINKFDGAIFSRVIRDDNEEIIAGIAGWTWAGACEIILLWVHENSRKRGIGKLLLEAAEEEARNKKCSEILVRSYSFQAPHFYEKHGFLIEHILDNFPKGFQYYILMKKL
jgi:ribosomal protein S18 acetylase RimI-like enzyme